MKGLKYAYLVFDNTKSSYSKSDNGTYFKVSSANPEFKTTDDAFKVWVGGLNALELAKSVFVTSDRELRLRLQEDSKVNLIKSGQFLQLAKLNLGEDKYNSLVNQ